MARHCETDAGQDGQDGGVSALRRRGVFRLVSLFPGIAITVFLIGLFADQEFLFGQAQRLTSFLPPIALDVLIARLDELESEPATSLGIGLAVSIIVVLWSGSRGMHALIYAATIAHTRQRRRSALGWLTLSIVATHWRARCS